MGPESGVQKKPAFSLIHSHLLLTGPAISLHPTGLGRWGEMSQKLIKAGRANPWSTKRDVAFFRGSRTSGERDALVLLSRSAPDLVDAKYTKNQSWKSKKAGFIFGLRCFLGLCSTLRQCHRQSQIFTAPRRFFQCRRECHFNGSFSRKKVLLTFWAF